MNFKYYADTDTLVLDFKEGRASETVDVTTGVLAHLDADGTIMGLEVDVASRHFGIGAEELVSSLQQVGCAVRTDAEFKSVLST